MFFLQQTNFYAGFFIFSETLKVRLGEIFIYEFSYITGKVKPNLTIKTYLNFLANDSSEKLALKVRNTKLIIMSGFKEYY